MKLYELIEEIEAIGEKIEQAQLEGVLDTEEAKKALYEQLDSIAEQTDQKLSSLWSWIKQLEAEVEILKNEKAKLALRQKRADTKAQSIKSYVAYCLEGKKWKAPDGPAAFGWRKSQEVRITDETKIPMCYFDYKPTIRKIDVKQGLKLGENIPGAELVNKANLQVK